MVCPDSLLRFFRIDKFRDFVYLSKNLLFGSVAMVVTVSELNVESIAV